MPEIVLDTAKLKGYSSQLLSLSKRIESLDTKMKAVYTKYGLWGVQQLLRLSPSFTKAGDNIKKCGQYAEQTAADFEKIENDLLKVEDKDIFLSVIKEFLLSNILPKPVIMGESESVYATLFKDFWNGNLKVTNHREAWEVPGSTDDIFARILGYETVMSVTPAILEFENDDAVGKHFKSNHEQTKKDFKQINKDEKFYDKETTIAEVKAEHIIEGSVIREKIEGKSKYASGSMEAKVLTGEASASASAGLYTYVKDKDGNTKRIFSPGVSAEVGASVAAFEICGEGRIGLGEDNNMLGVYGDFDAKAYSAEAKAKVAVNRNEIYAGASAEADLVKISGTAGVSVLGTDVGVTGSLKVGVGAHANVGYTDGKLKVDIGAAVGVGFDLGFEINVKGTVDAIVNNASTIYNTAVDVGGQVVSAVSDTAEAVYDGAKNLWNSIFG